MAPRQDLVAGTILANLRLLGYRNLRMCSSDPPKVSFQNDSGLATPCCSAIQPVFHTITHAGAETKSAERMIIFSWKYSGVGIPCGFFTLWIEICCALSALSLDCHLLICCLWCQNDAETGLNDVFPKHGPRTLWISYDFIMRAKHRPLLHCVRTVLLRVHMWHGSFHQCTFVWTPH